MIVAKIKTKNIIYTSIVFAVSYKGRKSQIIAFDEKYSKFIIIDDIWYNVIFVDYQTDDYVINRDNYISFWENNHIFSEIKKGKYTSEMLNEAKYKQKNLDKYDWIKLESINKCKALQISSESFHDAYILDISKDNNYNYIVFNTTWGKYVVLRFKKILKKDITIKDYYCDCNIIYSESAIRFEFDYTDSENYSALLEAEDVEWKIFFEKRYNVSDKQIGVQDDYIILKNKKIVNLKESKYEFIQSKNNNAVGYFLTNEFVSKYFFPTKDTFVSFRVKKMKHHLPNKLCNLQELIAKNNYELIENDYDYDYSYEDYCIKNYGNELYCHTYSQLKVFVRMLLLSAIPLGGNILVWLIVKLTNKSVKWIMFYIFGLGISFAVFLIEYFTLKKKANEIKIYEKAIVATGIINNLSIFFSDIISATIKKKKIKLVLKDGKKKTIDCGNDAQKMFSLIDYTVNKKGNK